MSYRIRYSEETRQALRTLPDFYRQRAKQVLESLARDPFPPKSKLLRDTTNLYRIRLGGWRIIYRVDDIDQEVLVVSIREKTGPETYEDLP